MLIKKDVKNPLGQLFLDSVAQYPDHIVNGGVKMGSMKAA